MPPEPVSPGSRRHRAVRRIIGKDGASATPAISREGFPRSAKQRRIFVSRLSYEDLWITNLGWDYLTEENAAPSIDLLSEQIVYLAGLTHQIAELALNG